MTLKISGKTTMGAAEHCIENIAAKRTSSVCSRDFQPSMLHSHWKIERWCPLWFSALAASLAASYLQNTKEWHRPHEFSLDGNRKKRFNSFLRQ
jgi:hypothetical protein